MNLFIYIFLLLLLIQLLQTTANLNGFSINLIHRDSKLSPLYNNSISESELMRKALVRSFSRADLLNSSIHINQKDFYSDVIPTEADYVMKLSVSSSRYEVFAEVDTGSDLLWIQCAPDDHPSKLDGELFDPEASTSYEPIFHGSKLCEAVPGYSPGKSNQCKYNYSYVSGYASGVLGNETFNFDSTTGDGVSFHKIVFGCNYKSVGTTENFQGIVGLGQGLLSLISQLRPSIEPRFSYCLPPPSSSSKIRFGQEAPISGAELASTPLETIGTSNFYHITLEYIKVEGVETKTPHRQGNLVIDSGSTLTSLHSSLYYELEDMMKNAIPAELVPDPPSELKLCYEAESLENVTLPGMLFHFPDGNIHLPFTNVFVMVENLKCMAIVPNQYWFSVLGNTAQVNFQVEYDLRKKQVSFAQTDCTTW